MHCTQTLILIACGSDLNNTPIHTLTHIIPALPLLMQVTGKLLYLNNYTTIPTNERWCKSQREILSHNRDQLDRPQRRARWLMIAHIRLNSSGTGCMHYALSKPSLIAPILMKKHTQSITVQQSVQSASPSLPPYIPRLSCTHVELAS